MNYFLIIGAQKAGTSWLHTQLRRHPEIFLPEWKEIHYFDTLYPPEGTLSFAALTTRLAIEATEAGDARQTLELLRVLRLAFEDNDGAAYRAFLTAGARHGTRICGEATPAYSILDASGFGAIERILESPRIIFVLRDPLTRLWSANRMAAPAGTTPRFWLGPADYLRSDYARTIRELESEIDRDRIHYEFYEHLFSKEALGAAARFLGVEPSWDFDVREIVREGRVSRMPEPPPQVLEQLQPVYDFVRNRFGERVPESWAR